ncbi:tRNA (cytosine(38)-C(5))-methyltransferase [Lepeophtheirus salmonis]|uniref:tRNA (cytosine(38)-C(5))-methyltransferase n=1 Tax=Lepeophtheirus salmonis TaxID=72036 RepID=UPI001AE1AD47|nr:tRNA (cytosine(38)-C(5))-methyltransferase-like [Lepeophtheirus salmonis]
MEGPIKVLELFSGIGGMRYALEKALEGRRGKAVFEALEINPSAVEVYSHNFQPIRSKNVHGLSKMDLRSYDILLMSPPCQPFTRQGHQRGLQDKRSEPFIQVMNIIPKLTSLKGVLLENVAGFETSEAHSLLLSTFSNWKIREFLICPTSFGIPNSRLRYYFLAVKSDQDFTFGSHNEIMTTLPEQITAICSLGDFLKEITPSSTEDYLLSDNILKKYGEVLDIVTSTSVRTCCFTKSYARYVEGTGSVLTPMTKEDVKRIYMDANSNSDEYLDNLKKLQLRYFSPEEIGALMGFPSEHFEFPNSISIASRYKLLGNSLNVQVVAHLLGYILNLLKV